MELKEINDKIARVEQDLKVLQEKREIILAKPRPELMKVSILVEAIMESGTTPQNVELANSLREDIGEHSDCYDFPILFNTPIISPVKAEDFKRIDPDGWLEECRT